MRDSAGRDSDRWPVHRSSRWLRRPAAFRWRRSRRGCAECGCGAGARRCAARCGRHRRVEIHGLKAAHAAGSTGRPHLVRAGPPVWACPVAAGSSAGEPSGPSSTNFVVDGARDLHADVVLLPRPAGRVASSSSSNSSTDCQSSTIRWRTTQYSSAASTASRSTRQCVGHARTIRGQQTPLGIARVADEGGHVVLDLDRGEVVDGHRPGVVAVEQCRSARARFSSAPASSNDRRSRLVHKGLLQLVLPVPRSRVVVDGERILECCCKRR